MQAYQMDRGDIAYFPSWRHLVFRGQPRHLLLIATPNYTPIQGWPQPNAPMGVPGYYLLLTL